MCHTKNARCNHICINTQGSYCCICRPGHLIDSVTKKYFSKLICLENKCTYICYDMNSKLVVVRKIKTNIYFSLFFTRCVIECWVKWFLKHDSLSIPGNKFPVIIMFISIHKYICVHIKGKMVWTTCCIQQLALCMVALR